MGILGMHELTAGSMKSGVKMELPFGMIINTSGGWMFLVYLLKGDRCSVELFYITTIK